MRTVCSLTATQRLQTTTSTTLLFVRNHRNVLHSLREQYDQLPEQHVSIVHTSNFINGCHGDDLIWYPVSSNLINYKHKDWRIFDDCLCQKLLLRAIFWLAWSHSGGTFHANSIPVGSIVHGATYFEDVSHRQPPSRQPHWPGLTPTPICLLHPVSWFRCSGLFWSESNWSKSIVNRQTCAVHKEILGKLYIDAYGLSA